MFKPMLAGTLTDVSALSYPVLVSPKLDGIRALVRGGVLVSRNLKPIPNLHTQGLFGLGELEGLDGELIVGSPTAKDAYRATMSGVMSVEGAPDVAFYVFDCMRQPELGFLKRLMQANGFCNTGLTPVAHSEVASDLELLRVEESYLDEGYEGVMVRSTHAPYKYGRGTVTAQDLLKLKRFSDAEARVVGCIELENNNNLKTTDALGHAKRSTRKAGKAAAGKLGALVVQTPEGVEFNIGTGFTDAERSALWQHPKALLGRLVKYRYFALGSKVAPRFPTFLGFRSEQDT